MAGLLNNKERILDTVFTLEGRRQVASGKMRAEFYSFTDSGTWYTLSDIYASGSKDLITRLELESCNLPQDQVTFEADDSGRLSVKEYKTSTGDVISVINGQIFSSSLSSTSVDITDETVFSSLAGDLLCSSSINNFKNLQIIGSPNILDEDKEGFVVSPTSVTFSLTDNTPFGPRDTKTANIDHIESLFADKRLSHIPNFKFMPPVNKDGSSLGNFVNIGQKPIFEYADLKSELDQVERLGFKQTVYFTEISNQNPVFGQLFEVGGGYLTKLDIIDFGIFILKNNEIQIMSQDELDRARDLGKEITTKHVFFAGKIYVDSNGSQTFVNLFTLVLS